MEFVGKKGQGGSDGILEKCVNTKVGIEALERLMEQENEEVSLRYILKYSTRKRTTSWQTENDGWRVRERRQQSKKVGKMSGMISSTKE